MEIGKKIFYDVITGEVIVTTLEVSGNVRVKTIEEHISSYPALAERTRESFAVLELDYGQYTQDFLESNGYRVNPETKTLEFSYPDPNEPEVEQPYQGPLSEQIASNMDYLLDVDFRLIMIELGMN